MCTNVIATPRVLDKPRWQLWTSVSSASPRVSPRICTPQSAASAASSPCPRPSSTPIKAPVPFTSTAIDRSPQTVWPGSGRDVAAHSIGPSQPCSAIVRNPLPHLDGRALTRGGFHDQPVHQPARSGQPEPESTAGGITVLHCPFDVGDARPIVFGPHDQCLSAFAVLYGNPDRPVTGVTGDVAGDLGDCRGDHGDIGQRETHVARRLVTRLASGNDVVGMTYVNDDVIRHRHVQSVSWRPAAGSAAPGPLPSPARCPCPRSGCRVGPLRTPLPAAGPRSRCARHAGGS